MTEVRPVIEYEGGAVETARRQVARGVLLVCIVLVMALVGIATLVYLGLHIGVTAMVVGAIGALIPVPVLVASFLWLDRYEPEPIGYLAACLCWGATFVAAAGAPLVEESLKALGPLLLFLFRPRAFSGVVDGIVYCGLSATGFAMLENILYLGGYGYAPGAEKAGVAGGVADVIRIFLVRIVLTGFAHPLFTTMIGIGLGVAARSRHGQVRVLAPVVGWLAAMILHGSWNGMLELASATKQYLIVLYGYI